MLKDLFLYIDSEVAEESQFIVIQRRGDPPISGRPDEESSWEKLEVQSTGSFSASRRIRMTRRFIMKIGIDARFWGIEHTGLGRYVMELIKQLQKIDSQNKYYIFLRKKYFNQLSFKKNFNKVLADFNHYTFAEQIYFPRVLGRYNLDLVHFPHFNVPLFFKGKFVVTIHDLIKHESVGPLTTTRFVPFYWFKYLAYRFVVMLAFRRAERVIVPSRWWRKRLVKKYNLEQEKIKVTYESVSNEFMSDISGLKKTNSREILTKYQLKKPFVIYTGNLYPHKNVFRLAKAIKRVNQQKRLFLVIVGAKSVFWQRLLEKVKEIGAEKWIILAGFVPDQELPIIYQEAEAFVFPSLLEGFGLTGLEAMAVGLPVVCSRSSCLPEIYQDAALYFNAKSGKDMAKKISRVIEDEDLRKRLVKKGLSRVNDFSWNVMARQTLDIYQSVV